MRYKLYRTIIITDASLFLVKKFETYQLAIVQFVSCSLRWCSRDSTCSLVRNRPDGPVMKNKIFYLWVWLIVNLPKSDFEGPKFSLQAKILIQRWVTRELAWREFLKINIFRHIEIIIFEPSPGGLTTSRWSSWPVILKIG